MACPRNKNNEFQVTHWFYSYVSNVKEEDYSTGSFLENLSCRGDAEPRNVHPLFRLLFVRS